MHVNVPRYRKNNGRSVGGERDERHKYADGLREGKKKTKMVVPFFWR